MTSQLPGPTGMKIGGTKVAVGLGETVGVLSGWSVGLTVWDGSWVGSFSKVWVGVQVASGVMSSVAVAEDEGV